MEKLKASLRSQDGPTSLLESPRSTRGALDASVRKTMEKFRGYHTRSD